MNELKYALRNLLRKPGYTLFIIGMLAIGIAVSGTIFTLMNALLFRPLPVRQPERLVRIYMKQDGRTERRISYPDFLDLRATSQVFEDAVATNLVGVGLESSQQTLGEVVSTNYFSVLGIQPTPGRDFGSEQEKAAIISNRLWRRAYSSDSQITGKQIRLNGELFTIIGVAPKQFSGTFAGAQIDVWVPITQVRWLGADVLTDRMRPSVQIIGRLNKNISRDRASAALSSVAEQLERAYPKTESKRAGVELVAATLLHGNLRKGISIFLTLMLAVSGLVILTSLANVANLVLISAAGKRREIAVRFALGAGRFSIFRQFLIENLLLTLSAGVAGFFLSLWCGTIIHSLNPIPSIPLQFDLGPDPRVFIFLVMLSALMGVLLGLVPQLQFRNSSLLPALQTEPGRATSSREASRLRSAFVICQVAVSLVLLIGAALFFQSLRNAQFMSPGFEPEKALAVDVDLKAAQMNEQQGKEFYRELIRRLSVLPGVDSVSLTNLAPLDIATGRIQIAVGNRQPLQVSFNHVSADYFKTLGVRLISGSEFSALTERSGELVAIINETMANRFWPGEIAIGKSFLLKEKNRTVRVVGVAQNVKYRTIGEDPEPHIYIAFEQNYEPSMTVLVRTQGNPALLLESVQREVRSIRPGIQGFFARTLEQHTSFAMLPARLAAWLSGIFGTIVLILSVMGIYGTVGYSVAIRTREIGIRLALGAKPSQIIRWILNQGIIITAIGLATGLLLSFAATRVLSKFLYGISASDLPTFFGVLLVLSIAAFAACYLPARRALRIDPAKALRDA
ncbi:ABC transporter permease [bacterium]|nr:ABC transporter permease [bacterium]